MDIIFSLRFMCVCEQYLKIYIYRSIEAYISIFMSSLNQFYLYIHTYVFNFTLIDFNLQSRLNIVYLKFFYNVSSYNNFKIKILFC
jgi:hypothetical protein